MRTIKFRAWTPSYGGTMRTPNSLIVVEGRVIGVDIGLIGASDIVLMQFTGLTDKNGVEIYEGDIVRNEFGSLDEVEFEQGPDGDDRGTFYWSGFCLMGNSDKWEIVGNIYESPERLK